jgi:FkbM family methyltransferase
VNSHETALFEEIYKDRGYEMVGDFVPKAGWTVFDVGANVGIFAVQEALRGAHVYAFEPNPDCYRRLTWTVEANNLCTKISAFNVAVAATPGSGTMLIERGFTLGGTIMPHKEARFDGH